MPSRRPSRSTAFADLPSALLQCASGIDDRCPESALAGRWARVGGLLGVVPGHEVVDLERLVVATAAYCDERMGTIAASWLAVHHALVFGRKLAGMAAALANARAPAAAGLRTILDQACALASELPGDSRLRPENLEIARARYSGTRAKVASRRGTSGSHPVQPVEWVVRRVPELRVRALLGATLEAEIVLAALVGHVPLHDEDVVDAPIPSVGAIARHAGVSYGGVHGAANRLVRRGLLVRHVVHGQVTLRPTTFVVKACGWPASSAEGS